VENKHRERMNIELSRAVEENGRETKQKKQNTHYS